MIIMSFPLVPIVARLGRWGCFGMVLFFSIDFHVGRDIAGASSFHNVPSGRIGSVFSLLSRTGAGWRVTSTSPTLLLSQPRRWPPTLFFFLPLKNNQLVFPNNSISTIYITVKMVKAGESIFPQGL